MIALRLALVRYRRSKSVKLDGDIPVRAISPIGGDRSFSFLTASSPVTARFLFFAVVTLVIGTLAVSMFDDHDRSDLHRDRASQSAERVTAAAVEPTFVGKAVCGECHQDNFQLHQNSGHAQTFHAANQDNIVQHFAGKTADAGTPHGFYTYLSGPDGLQVFRRRTADASDGDVDDETFQYALGSGQNAITLINLDSKTDGDPVLLEHRVSWFRSHGGFGLTPGHLHHVPEEKRELFGELFEGRPLQQCVWCHTTSGEVIGDEVKDLIANVNCEKCHGPGSEHVRQARQSDTPPPYSVGKADWDFESELQLCGNCHRLPRHVDPKDIRDYIPMMLRFQPIGLVRSACYLESEGQMMCSTCHDPHAHFTSKTQQQYIDDCVGCHQPDNDHHTVCSVSTSEGCIDCHMPAMKVEQGMVFHDHWIRVRPEN